jgi:glycosyltransferase involved in cell wall biosynthesis
MDKITAYILAYNEADKIRSAVHSVLWADEIVLADSGSTDDTAQIAAALGVRVVQIPFEGFGQLRNQALAACRHPWIFSLDADERCTPEVRDEILGLLRAGPAHDVYFVPRRNYFMGRWIRHSGLYPDYRQPQLFRNGAMTYRPDPVHEGYVLHTTKPVGHLRHAIWQMPYRDLAEVLHKTNRYSTLNAQRLAREGRTGGLAKALARGLWMFFRFYILRLGVLDGWAGFVLALGNFEGTFYKYAKLRALQAGWQFPESPPLLRDTGAGEAP